MKVVAAALLVAVVAPALVFTAKLPSYIKVCKRDDPKLNECAVKNGNEAIPKLADGDSKLGIPRLDPLELDKVVIGDSKSGKGLGIVFTCNKCKIAGLKTAHLDDAKVDLKKQHVELKLSIPTLKVNGKYTATGKVLILPISGNGDASLTLGGLKLVYSFGYDLKKGKDGKEYLKLKDPKLDLKAEDFKIQLTNLFNGDKTLGNQMNTFLNENWREVMTEFRPAIEVTIEEVVKLIVTKVTEKITYDELFP